MLGPAARELYPQWADVARQTVGFLRFSADRYGGQPGFAALIAELSVGSAEFLARWAAAREVREKTWGSKQFRHRVVGEFELHYETIGLPGDEGRSLVVLIADPAARTTPCFDCWAVGAPTPRRGGRAGATARAGAGARVPGRGGPRSTGTGSGRVLGDGLSGQP
ncbi:hypothetical protein OG871_17800 [Kitasatospora sp. NBC_00374]